MRIFFSFLLCLHISLNTLKQIATKFCCTFVLHLLQLFLKRSWIWLKTSKSQFLISMINLLILNHFYSNVFFFRKTQKDMKHVFKKTHNSVNFSKFPERWIEKFKSQKLTRIENLILNTYYFYKLKKKRKYTEWN